MSNNQKRAAMLASVIGAISLQKQTPALSRINRLATAELYRLRMPQPNTRLLRKAA